MVTVAKMADGRMVEIIKYADRVGFSDMIGWICVCFDFEKPKRRQEQVRWVPADTSFTWCREFTFGSAA